MASIALLVALVGVVGSGLTFAAVEAMAKVPVPSIVWPILAVAGLVGYFVFRRPSD